jgi:hypothetical protein
MDNSWAFDLETKLFSVIKRKTENKLKVLYPQIFYTATDNPKDGDVHYPTVYMHELSGVESARNTEGNEINGILYSMQIEVTTNKSQKVAKSVLQEIAFAFKSMGFGIQTFPESSNGDNYYRSVMRVRKMIGRSDTL